MMSTKPSYCIKVLCFCYGKVCQSVSWHFVCGKLINIKMLFLHFLVKPHIMNIDVVKLSLELWSVLDW